MGFWPAAVIIVAIATLSEMYRARLRSQAGRAEKAYENFSERLARLEDRMANLETIVLEKEHAKMFSELHSERTSGGAHI